MTGNELVNMLAGRLDRYERRLDEAEHDIDGLQTGHARQDEIVRALIKSVDGLRRTIITASTAIVLAAISLILFGGGSTPL